MTDLLVDPTSKKINIRLLLSILTVKHVLTTGKYFNIFDQVEKKINAKTVPSTGTVKLCTCTCWKKRYIQ